MAEYLAQNPSITKALGPQANSARRFFEVDLDSPTEFLPENREKLAYRMTQIAAERPEELASEFKKTFSDLFGNHAEARARLLQLARYVGDTPAGDQVKEIVLQQALLFIPSLDAADSTFGTNSLQTYLDMEKDPVKRKLGASRITSNFQDL